MFGPRIASVLLLRRDITTENWEDVKSGKFGIRATTRFGLGVLRVSAIKNRPEEGAWLFYNKPCEVKPVTIDPRAQGFVYYIDHIVNQSF